MKLEVTQIQNTRCRKWLIDKDEPIKHWVDRVGNGVREPVLSDAFRFPGHFLVPSSLGQQRGVYQNDAPAYGTSAVPLFSSSSPSHKTIVYLISIHIIHYASPCRTPQKKSFSKGHRSSPYGSASRKKPAGGTFGASLNPNLGNLDTSGQHPSPNIELAHKDPLHHHIIRSGFHRGKTLAEVHVEDDSYMGWIRGKHYNTLSHDHILRRAIDQWDAESKTTGTWTVPALNTAPARFRQANPKFYLYMQERCLKKLWKVTPAELEAAGAKFTQNMAEKTKPEKICAVPCLQIRQGAG
jgi:hypothetical protein